LVERTEREGGLRVKKGKRKGGVMDKTSIFFLSTQTETEEGRTGAG
jgi:hypothetical protein